MVWARLLRSFMAVAAKRLRTCRALVVEHAHRGRVCTTNQQTRTHVLPGRSCTNRVKRNGPHPPERPLP